MKGTFFMGSPDMLCDLHSGHPVRHLSVVPIVAGCWMEIMVGTGIASASTVMASTTTVILRPLL